MTKPGEPVLSHADEDLIAGQVLELVRGLVRKFPVRVPGLPEPTGIAYSPEMAPWVEQSSDKRGR